MMGEGGHSDIVTQLSAIARQLSALVSLQSGLAQGTFTCSASATTVVPSVDVEANSAVLLMPTNAAAAALQGSAKHLYLSSISAGASFTLATGNGVAAAGTETFLYLVQSPG